MICRDGMGDVLQQHRLAGARRGNDQPALAFAERRHDVDHPGRVILLGRITRFHFKPLIRIERRQVIEMHLVAGFFGIFEIDQIDLDQGKIPFAFLRAADLTLNRVAGAKGEFPDLARTDVDVVRTSQVIGIRGAQEAEPVLQNLNHAFADDLDIANGQVFQDCEQQLLLAQCARIFNFKFLGQRDELGGRLQLEILELDLFQIVYGSHYLFTMGSSGTAAGTLRRGRIKPEAMRSRANIAAPRTSANNKLRTA